MAISLNTAGSWAFAASGSVTVTLPTHATGNMLLARVAYKSSAIATCSASTASAGWTKLGEFHDGTTNSGSGTGSVAVALFWKEAASASEASPVINFSQTVTQVGHVALSYAKASTELWITPVGDGGPDTTADTSKSMTIASHVAVTGGDMVDFFMGIRDNTTMTVPDVTQTGVVYDTVSEQPATAGTDTTGDDGAYDGGYRLATAGVSLAAAVVTGTLSTSETGSAWTTRLRVFVGTNAAAENAAGTGASFLAAIALAISVGLSSGAGTASDAAITTARDAPAELAAGMGTAANPTLSLESNASAGTGSGTAGGPASTVAVNPTVAAGTGTAYDATVSTSSGTDANAGLAAGSGTAYSASVSLESSAGSGAGSGASGGPSSTVAVNPSAATGSGAAYNATAGAPFSWGPWSDTYQNPVVAEVRHRGGLPAEAAYVTRPAARRMLHVKARAEIARGDGQAFDAYTVWEDDETAVLILLGIL